MDVHFICGFTCHILDIHRAILLWKLFYYDLADGLGCTASDRSIRVFQNLYQQYIHTTHLCWTNGFPWELIQELYGWIFSWALSRLYKESIIY